jgi:hypothetical protein
MKKKQPTTADRFGRIGKLNTLKSAQAIETEGFRENAISATSCCTEYVRIVDGGVAELAEGGGLEIRQVVRPSDTNQQLTAQSITQTWGVLGGFGSKMCNRMCNSVMRIPDHADHRSGPWRSGFQTDGDH